MTDYGLISKALHQLGAGEPLRDVAVQAIKAGLDREIPGVGPPAGFNELVIAVQEIEVVDEAVRRVVEVKFRFGLFEQPFANADMTISSTNTSAYRELAYIAATESMVLIKNKEAFLPLNKSFRKIVVLGSITGNPKLGGYSSWDIEVVSILDGIRRSAPSGVQIVAPGETTTFEHDTIHLRPIPLEYL